jgi:hypothetical protein
MGFYYPSSYCVGQGLDMSLPLVPPVQPTDICMPREDWIKYERATRARCYRNMALTFVGGVVAGIAAWIYIMKGA